MTFDWTAIGAGLGVGTIVGLTGVGGGSLMTPLLISVFGLDKAVAIGTDLWFAGLTKVSGSVAHHREGRGKDGAKEPGKEQRQPHHVPEIGKPFLALHEHQLLHLHQRKIMIHQIQRKDLRI